MILIPTLELLGGNLVRLVGGAEDKPTVLSGEPLQTARELRRAGAMFFHIVDLDAVFESDFDNRKVFRELTEDMIPFQVRGGIRTAERADEILRLGADRVVLGALPFLDQSAARELVQRFGVRIVATLDVKGDHVLVDGNSGARLELDQALEALEATGVEHVIYNGVEFAGEDAALDLDMLRRVMSNAALQVYARCTFRAPAELEPLLELQDEGLRGVILNHALALETAPFTWLLEEAAMGAGL